MRPSLRMGFPAAVGAVLMLVLSATAPVSASDDISRSSGHRLTDGGIADRLPSYGNSDADKDPPVAFWEASPLVQPNSPLRIKVNEAVGGKTVIGQLTVARATKAGFVTAWDCSSPRPVKSDVNYNGAVEPVASNRLIVTANDDGEVCFYTQEPVAIIVDVFAVTDGIQAIPNQRTDTRPQALPPGAPYPPNCRPRNIHDEYGNVAGTILACDSLLKQQPQEIFKINVPQAVGGKTTVGQLTVAQTIDPGFVTAYGCDDGVPRGTDGKINKSDLNYDGRINPVASNRLIVTADNDGDVCFYTEAEAHLVIDINGIADADVMTPLANQRTDTRIGHGLVGSPLAQCKPGFEHLAKDAVRRENGDGTYTIVYLCETGRGIDLGPSSVPPHFLTVHMAEAVGGKTVVGQLTMTQAQGAGFFTAYACADGIPRNTSGGVAKSDLNFSRPAAVSNRLIVEADANGDICIYTLVASHIVVDINGIFETIDAFPNQRTDTRVAAGEPLPPSATERGGCLPHGEVQVGTNANGTPIKGCA